MARSKPLRTTSNWKKLLYIDEEKRPCVDLIVDGVNRKFLVQDLVCLVYHGPRPAPYSVSHLIDTSKPCTPDNVGWLSQGARAQIKKDL